MRKLFLSQEAILKAADKCEKLTYVVKKYGVPKVKVRSPGFESLVKIIISQQVSVSAADAIWLKLKTGLPLLSPEKFCDQDPKFLKNLGLSEQKIKYILSLANFIITKELDFEKLPTLSDRDVISTLVKVKGIGQWSAQIYTLFVLGRPDIWPESDLALCRAVSSLYEFSKLTDSHFISKFAQTWAPWRSGAALLLWHYYKRRSKLL